MFTERQTSLLAWGIVAHCIADWFLQNHWQANTKTDLRKLGGWVHAAIHGLVAAIVFPWPWAVGLAIVHLIIDTRKPLEWWGRLVGQSNADQASPHCIPAQVYIPFAFGRDQAAHVICIAVAAYFA